MKKFIFIITFVFLFALTTFAQTPTPTPKLVEDNDVVKISTTLIQIDVTVTDKKGKIVTDLKPEDFEIYENGEKQDITNFSFISAGTETIEKTAKPDKNAVPLPPINLKPEQIKRTIALVVDDLSLSFESVPFVRQSLRKFVDEQMQDGDLVAIVRTGAGIGALQQFTSDKRQLYAAIERVRWNPLGAGGISAVEQTTDISDNSAADDSQDVHKEVDLNEYRNSVIATGSLSGINYVIEGMKELPGRKSVILLSDGFKLFETNGNGLVDSSRVLDAVNSLVDAANRASVVIYSIDARGLQTLAATTAVTPPGDTLFSGKGNAIDDFYDKQDSLVYLAKETGGFALINSNDLSGGIRKVLADQSYYLIGYQPDSETFDSQKRKFNKFEVKVKRDDVKVRYRSGFFGVSDEQAEKKPKQTTASQQLVSALSSPFAANEISLSLNTLFGNDKQQGSFVRSLLHINAKDLKFTDEANGSKKTTFDVLAISFGDNGAIIDQIAKSYTVTFKPDAYQRVLKEGILYYFTFPVKKPGAYQYRVAIRDGATERVGSANQFIEVPNLKKERLTVSGIILENVTLAQWENLTGSSSAKTNAPANFIPVQTNPLNDTSLRQFKRGTILRYGFEVYNAKLDAAQKPNLTTQVRIFRDGKIILEGKQTLIPTTGQTDLQRVKFAGALNLGDEMTAGDYVLQIVIRDELAKDKRKIATQFVQFEILQ